MLDVKDWAELDHIILQIHDIDTGDDFRNFILGPLVEFLGATFASWNVHNAQMYLVEVANSPSHEAVIAPLVPALNRTLPTHPLFAYYMDFKAGKVRYVDTVERTRDHITTNDYYALPFYREVASKVGVEDQLLVHIAVKDGVGILLTFHSQREFTEVEHLKASIIRGHILARHHTLQSRRNDLDKQVLATTASLAEKLTSREMETMRLICKGMSNGEIAKELGISTRTVDKYVSSILEKLKIDCRTRVIARYAPWVN